MNRCWRYDSLPAAAGRIRGIEILPVVYALVSPAVTVLDDFPLKSRMDPKKERRDGVSFQGSH